MDFSHNELCEVGGMFGNILAEHSKRRTETLWMCGIRT